MAGARLRTFQLILIMVVLTVKYYSSLSEMHRNEVCYANLRSRVDGELKFALLSVVHTQSLEEKRGESRSGTSTERVEDKESLKTGTLVSQFPDSVQTKIYDLFSNGVVASSVVVSGIFLQSIII